MASLLDGILAPFKGIINLLNSPMATLIIVLFLFLGLAGLYLWMQIKPIKKILYFSPEEHQGKEFTVERTTPAFLYTKKSGGDRYRFIRWRDAFQFQLGMRATTRWLATKGTAFAKTIESGEAGEYTLFTVMQSVWGDAVIAALEDDIKQKLIESTVMITVRIEPGTTPEGHTALSELHITKEADEEMSRIFGENIRREFNKEDWIRSAALVGCGVALAYVAQAMGLLAGVAT